jgi:hypothetical protein
MSYLSFRAAGPISSFRVRQRALDRKARLVVVVGLLFFSFTLAVGDGHGGRREARVPEIVLGAHGDRIMPAIPIIAPARGFQRHGKLVMPAIGECETAAWLGLAVLIHHHIRRATRLHPEPPLAVIVPETVMATRFPLGGDSVAGLAATVMMGGVVSPSSSGVATKL